MSSEWQHFQKRAQHVGSIVGITLNALLIHLVLNKSPSSLGVYKYLINFTAVFEIVLAITDLLVQPIFYSYGSTFVIVVNVVDSYLSYGTLKVLISIYCGFFGSLLATFSIQFVYRFWVVSGSKWIESFNGWKILGWFMLPVISGFIWGLAAYFPCGPRPASDEYLRQSIQNEFNLSVSENLYIAPYFYEKRANGIVEIYLPSFLSILVDCMIINLSITTAFYFGLMCYKTLRKTSHLASTQSYKSLQTQLFYSLVTQTLIPVFLMHIPAFVMFACTFLEVNVGPLSGIVTVTIALFPAIDPLPTLFIVKNYRIAIQNYIVIFLNKIAKWIKPDSVTGGAGGTVHPSTGKTS